MRFLVDENVPLSLVQMLKNKGFDVIRCAPFASNHIILEQAFRENRIIITSDSDFIHCVPKKYDKTVKRIVFLFYKPNWDQAISFFEKNLNRISALLKHESLVVIRQAPRKVALSHGVILELD